MRTIYDKSGTDITSTVLALMLTENAIYQNEIFQIASPWNQNNGVGDTPTKFGLTDCEGYVQWSPITGSHNPIPTPAFAQGFFPANVRRDAISFELGLAAEDFKVTWISPPSFKTGIPFGGDPSSGPSGNIFPVIELFRQGAFDNGSIQVWRMFSDAYGSAGSLGIQGLMALTMGRIADVTIDPSGKCEISCRAYLDLLDQQVPRYTLQANNRMNQLGLFQSSNSQGLPFEYPTPNPQFETNNDPGNTLTRVAFSETHGTLYPRNTFAGMYCYLSGQPLNRIAASWSDLVQNYLVLVTPLRTLANSSQLLIYKSRDVDVQTSPLGTGTLMPGFPFLPRPEDQV